MKTRPQNNPFALGTLVAAMTIAPLVHASEEIKIPGLNMPVAASVQPVEPQTAPEAKQNKHEGQVNPGQSAAPAEAAEAPKRLVLVENSAKDLPLFQPVSCRSGRPRTSRWKLGRMLSLHQAPTR